MKDITYSSAGHLPVGWAYRGWAIFGFIGALLSVCIVGAIQLESVLAWSVGLIYVSYDTWLLAYVAWKTTKLNNSADDSFPSGNTLGALASGSSQPSVGVLVPVHNESEVVLGTLANLLRQTEAPKKIIIVNDGSTDDTRSKLTEAFDFKHTATDVGVLYSSGRYPHLFLLNKENSGKADSLNQALRYLDCEIVITVDADTLLETNAIYEMRRAFVKEPKLVAACGILQPVTRGGLGARIFGLFQYFEYLRAFLSRAAWSQSNALLLVSGAFSAYNKPALLAVGGYDAASLVEDYELIHRMHKYSCEHDLQWRIDIVEDAHATTDAPTTVGAFIKQRKRWFAGFLRTQFKYRQMIGVTQYQDVGRFMLPIKTVDTLQPIFGLVALFLLWRFLVTDAHIATHVLIVIGIKLTIDYCFHIWALRKYHLWLGQKIAPHRWWQATLCCLVDPFFFQPLRHLSALIGWTFVLHSNVRWKPIRMASNN